MSDDSDLEILDHKKGKEVIELDSSSSSASTEDEDDNSKAGESSKNKPSGSECLARCKEFAKVTNTDTALAMFYLQDNDWDLEVIYTFFHNIY